MSIEITWMWWQIALALLGGVYLVGVFVFWIKEGEFKFALAWPLMLVAMMFWCP